MLLYELYGVFTSICKPELLVTVIVGYFRMGGLPLCTLLSTVALRLCGCWWSGVRTKVYKSRQVNILLWNSQEIYVLR